MGAVSALFLIVFAIAEVGAFLLIPRLAKVDQEVWLKQVLHQEPSSYTTGEYVVQCLFEFVLFNAGVFIGIALGWLLCKT
jgi:hypothetical protein